MRKALWSAAALLVIALSWGPGAQAATTQVAAGSSNEPLKFTPADITVPVGGMVEWKNETDFQHDVKADDGSFNSDGFLNKGEKFSFTFSKAGDFKYFCTPHKDAGMVGVVHVTGGATQTTAASTTTTVGGSTTTTAGGGSTTTTTAKAAAGGSTTTTTAGGGVTSTTQAPSVTPTSAPETGGVTTTTAAVGGGAEDAAGGHGSEAPAKDDSKSSPIGIAFVALSTLMLLGISGKLLASKS
jgi:plastocyanin